MPQFDRPFFERLKALDKATLDAKIGKLVLDGSRSILRRRDMIVAQLEKVAKSKTEAFVRRRESSSWRCFRDHGVLDGQGEEGACAMADRRLKIWYDREGDFLEVMFEDRAGYFRETDNDQVMEKVDDQGRVIGFSILKVSALQSAPLEVALSS
jgi:hypothetical protein